MEESAGTRERMVGALREIIGFDRQDIEAIFENNEGSGVPRTAFANALQSAAWEGIARLHSKNRSLWNAEDQARSSTLSDPELGRLKRTIDGLNSERNALIEEIDRAVKRTLDPVINEHAPRADESPGLLLDRLSILHLRQRALHRLIASERVDPEPRALLDEAVEEIELLWGRLHRAISLIREGKRSFRVRSRRKVFPTV